MTSVVINNYNYSGYVLEAVHSALNQTVQVDRVIVVDDGSSDNSLEIINGLSDPRIEVISKKNGGQLSCFNVISELVEDSEIVFFLDADDRFLPDHVRKCLQVYHGNPGADFVFTRHQLFGIESRPGQILCDPASEDLGYSVYATRENLVWYGGPTSTISIRGALLKRFLPCPLDSDWKVRADDVLVFGSSLAGGRKYFLDQLTVEYRVHQDNHFHNKKNDLSKSYLYLQKRERLLSWLMRHFGMPYTREASQIAIEFKLSPLKSLSQLFSYFNILIAGKSGISEKIRAFLSLAKSYGLFLIGR
mgnify:CR=1 FL=1